MTGPSTARIRARKDLGNTPEVFVEDRLFATLDPLTREVPLGENAKALVTDTVGFIRKLPHDLVASFRSTMEEAVAADLVLHVIDASHPQFEEQRAVGEQVLKDLGVDDARVIDVLNKIDRAADGQRPAANGQRVAISALIGGLGITGHGHDLDAQPSGIGIQPRADPTVIRPY